MAKGAAVSQQPRDKIKTTASQNEGKTEQNKILLYAEAVIENSPNDRLSKDELDSLSRFITHNEHLARNVSIVKVEKRSSKEAANKKYIHTAIVHMNIRTKALGEHPKSYLQKQLGKNNSWHRGNGSKITFSNISQKKD